MQHGYEKSHFLCRILQSKHAVSDFDVFPKVSISAELEEDPDEEYELLDEVNMLWWMLYKLGVDDVLTGNIDDVAALVTSCIHSHSFCGIF